MYILQDFAKKSAFAIKYPASKSKTDKKIMMIHHEK